MNIREGVDDQGCPWISGTFKIRVDQEIDGVVESNLIPVEMYAKKYKKGPDGKMSTTENKIYQKIQSYKDTFISMAAADPENGIYPTQVTINNGVLRENIWVDNDLRVHEDFRITTNFINLKRESEKEQATFSLTGVVCTMADETKNDEPTGRLIINMCVVGYNGVANKIKMYATGSKKAHVESNWSQGDTVKAVGRIHMMSKTEMVKESQGWGEPIEKPITISCRELILTGGSNSGLEDDYSYDASDIKRILDDRQAYIAKMQENRKNGNNSKKTISSSKLDFDF